MGKPIAALQKDLNIEFNNPSLLQQALVHRSYINEHPDFELNHNERLEFLGDAVLELAVTRHLFHDHPKENEGTLTNWRAALVNAEMLSRVADEMLLNDYLLLSRGEAQDGNSKARQSILANAVEAFIGALYLDQGFDAAEDFVKQFILAKLPSVLEQRLYLDPKSAFQEKSQDLRGITPSYRVLNEEGPDHSKIFTVGVFIDQEHIATGQGSSKQEAQVDAAKAAIEKKGWTS